MGAQEVVVQVQCVSCVTEGAVRKKISMALTPTAPLLHFKTEKVLRYLFPFHVIPCFYVSIRTQSLITSTHAHMHAHAHAQAHKRCSYRPLLGPFIIIWALLLQPGIQLQGLNSSPWQGGATFLCEFAPHARLFSAQSVTLLEFAGPSASASSFSTMRRGEPQLRLAPSAAWCPSE